MKLVKAWFNRHHLPMLDDDAYMLYAPTRVLSLALATNEGAMTNFLFKHRERLNVRTIADLDAKDFFQQHKT